MKISLKYRSKKFLKYFFIVTGLLFLPLSLLLTSCGCNQPLGGLVGATCSSTAATDNTTSQVRMIYPNQNVTLGENGVLELNLLSENGGTERLFDSGSLTWTSSDSNVVTISDTGGITAKSAGSSTITLSAKVGEQTFTDSIQVTVDANTSGGVAGVTVTPYLIMLAQGESKTLKVFGNTVQNTEFTPVASDISYSSSNTSVVTVETTTTGAPKLTAGSSYGSAVITVNYKGVSGQSIKVTVAQNINIDGDTTDDVGQYSSVFVDNTTFHVSYYNATQKQLKYAYWNGNSWDINVVEATEFDDSNAGQSSNIVAIGGTPYISYYDGVSKKVKVRYMVQGVWSILSAIESTGTMGPHSASSVHKSELIATYAYDNSSVKFTRRSNQQWNTSTVSSSYLGGTGIDLKENGNKIGISYIDANKHISYKESTDAGATWTSFPGLSETASESNIEATGDTALNLDENGFPHISYYVEGAGVQLSKIITDTNTGEQSWGTTPLDNDYKFGGKYLGATIDSKGQDRISFYDAQNGNLRMVRYNKSRQKYDKSFTADDGGSNNEQVGEYSSIGINAYGQSIITYYNKSLKKLQYYTEPYSPN